MFSQHSTPFAYRADGQHVSVRARSTGDRHSVVVCRPVGMQNNNIVRHPTTAAAAAAAATWCNDFDCGGVRNDVVRRVARVRVK